MHSIMKILEFLELCSVCICTNISKYVFHFLWHPLLEPKMVKGKAVFTELSSWSHLGYACVCSCNQLYVLVCTHTGACVCMWKPESNLGCCPLGAKHFSFLRQSVSLIWRSLIRLGWLTIKQHICQFVPPQYWDYMYASQYTFYFNVESMEGTWVPDACVAILPTELSSWPFRVSLYDFSWLSTRRLCTWKKSHLSSKTAQN